MNDKINQQNDKESTRSKSERFSLATRRYNLFPQSPGQNQKLSRLHPNYLQLLIAIISRKIGDIEKILSQDNNDVLPHSQLTYTTPQLLENLEKNHTKNYFEKLINEYIDQPFHLALFLCKNETPEATQSYEATRLSVVSTLVENFEHLKKFAEKYHLPMPERNNIIDYAHQLNIPFVEELVSKIPQSNEEVVAAYS